MRNSIAACAFAINTPLLLAYIILLWAQSGFGELTQEKLAMVALILIVVAIQTIFNSFLASVLQIRYR